MEPIMIMDSMGMAIRYSMVAINGIAIVAIIVNIAMDSYSTAIILIVDSIVNHLGYSTTMYLPIIIYSVILHSIALFAILTNPSPN